VGATQPFDLIPYDLETLVGLPVRRTYVRDPNAHLQPSTPPGRGSYPCSAGHMLMLKLGGRAGGRTWDLRRRRLDVACMQARSGGVGRRISISDLFILIGYISRRNLSRPRWTCDFAACSTPLYRARRPGHRCRDADVSRVAHPARGLRSLRTAPPSPTAAANRRIGVRSQSL
jgi:hypothetical protein